MTKKTKKVSPVLTPTKGPPRRRLWAVVDIESKDGDTQKGGFTRPFLTGYYDGSSNPIIFSGPQCISHLVDFLLDPVLCGMTYYAHNGGAFDWLHLLETIAAKGYYFEILSVGSKIQCLKVKTHKGSKKGWWTFLDSLQLMPARLEQLTKAFNTETQKDDDFDYNVHEDDPRWKPYLEADLVSLYQTLIKFYDLVEDKLGGEVGMTAAATSMNTFRRSYQSKPIERHVKHHDLFRECYYGGRVEIFNEELTDLHYYDYNSSYPFTMLAPMPVGSLEEWEGEPDEWLKKGRIGFARANVSVPLDTYLPVLPYRTKDKQSKLIFPVGEFSGSWPAVELFAAIEQGATVEWLDSVWISSERVFGPMVHKLYAFRDKSSQTYNEALSYVAKILLNSLYGKFATNEMKDKIIWVPEGEDFPEDSLPLKPRDPDCRVYVLSERISADYIIPQISAHITALARLNLHRDMLVAAKGGKLAYCDTDSMLTTANLDSICSSDLGALKDEGDGRKYHGTFIQPKLYYIEGTDGTTVCKGSHAIPKWANAVEPMPSKTVRYKFLDKDGKVVKPDKEKNEPINAVPKGAVTFKLTSNGSVHFTEQKAVMKGYRSRSKEGFLTVKQGDFLTYQSLEKIGAMIKKEFSEGPKMLEIKKCMRGEDTKRAHNADGTTSPLVIYEDEDEQQIYQ